MLRESKGGYTTLHVKYCCSKVSIIRGLLQFLQLPELCAAIILQDNSTGAFLGREQKAPECKSHSDTEGWSAFRILKIDQIVAYSDQCFSNSFFSNLGKGDGFVGWVFLFNLMFNGMLSTLKCQ